MKAYISVHILHKQLKQLTSGKKLLRRETKFWKVWLTKFMLIPTCPGTNPSLKLIETTSEIVKSKWFVFAPANVSRQLNLTLRKWPNVFSYVFCNTSTTRSICRSTDCSCRDNCFDHRVVQLCHKLFPLRHHVRQIPARAQGHAVLQVSFVKTPRREATPPCTEPTVIKEVKAVKTQSFFLPGQNFMVGFQWLM